jgi:hypothetical protein
VKNQARGSSPVADRAASPAPAVANDDDPSPATRKHLRAQTRELAQRFSGTVEVLLLWRPEIDRIELSVRDLATGAGFSIVVAPGDAIDSFYHPYAYAARRENSHGDDRDGTMILDG